MRLYRIQDEVL